MHIYTHMQIISIGNLLLKQFTLFSYLNFILFFLYVTQCYFSKKNHWLHNFFIMYLFKHHYLVENTSFIFLQKDFIYLFLERGEGREKERERNINVWLPLTHPHWGPGPQPRQVSWVGIKLVTLGFTGWCSIHWVTKARAKLYWYIWLATL